MQRLELSDIEKIEEYRKCLETEPIGLEKSSRLLLVDELMEKIDQGYGEPIEMAYLLFAKYGEWYAKSGNDIFADMRDEALFIVDLCDSEIIF